MSFFDTIRSALKVADGQRMKKRPFTSAIVVAAGSSSRMQGVNKLFEELDGIPVLAHTLMAVNACEFVDEIIVATRADDVGRVAALMSSYGIRKISRIIPGGASRGESVTLALRECSRDAELVAVHDGARPLITPELFERAIRCAMRTRACVVAVPVKDTIKQVTPEGIVAQTLPRETLYAVQTPQVFETVLLKAAYEKAAEDNLSYTDDASVVEALGKHVYICEGDYMNIKITEPSDLVTAAQYLEVRNG